MFRTIIYKDKITSTIWEEENQEWLEYNIADNDGQFTQYFNQAVEIKEDVTVEDFMNHLEKYEKVIDFCFAAYNHGNDFRLYLEDMRAELSDDYKKDTKVSEIEMCWFGEIVDEELNIFGTFRGWIDEKTLIENGLESDGPYGMEFTPLSLWKNSLISLNENIIIIKHEDENSVEENVFFDGFKAWRLHDFISSFLHELTAYGSPKEREELVQKIKDYDIKEVAKDKEKAKFWLDFLESELKNSKVDMSQAIENEDYEKASQLKKDISDLEKEIKELYEEIEKEDE